ncbi:hypothetical protein FFJ24_013915 [Pedobacter sp. KBS0701]|uniref:hypothetical protein n=1 Tax=Pedobacter sp. KBS0701 TaxID=2578106 RepID=UPI00110E6B82|nr:hypothetical protein [Pedobacter sp. KBS0701]QDW25858.1 hypothetical protein FFJ24_013915 [Pedobacter sp. KBS0701]
MVSPTNSSSPSGLKTAIIRFLIYGSIMALLSEFLKWNVQHEAGSNKFNEESVVEYVQSLLLLLSALTYLYISFKHKSSFPLAFALFSFTMASLIREQDAFLDEHVYDGAWQTGAFGLLLLATIIVYRNKRLFFANLNDFVNKFSFGILLSGILTTYIFARLYGRKVFWMAVMENQYTRDVKNVSEESLELFGYTLILIATVEFYLLTKAKSNYLALTMSNRQTTFNLSA